jgi:hypothetical protein
MPRGRGREVGRVGASAGGAVSTPAPCECSLGSLVTADRAGVCRSTNTGIGSCSVMHIAFRNTAIGYLYTFTCKKLTLTLAIFSIAFLHCREAMTVD